MTVPNNLVKAFIDLAYVAEFEFVIINEMLLDNTSTARRLVAEAILEAMEELDEDARNASRVNSK